LEYERGNTSSRCLESSLCKKLWASRTTEKAVKLGLKESADETPSSTTANTLK